jgi:predicted SAM-dependent methyltransferase
MAATSQIGVAPLRLNLGCSDSHMSGWVNVDLHEPADQIVDLSKEWPWETSSVQSIKAWDVVEHLADKIHTMNECYRVLQPGGTVDLFVPTTDGRGAFQDPTHRSFWTPNDLFYFCDQYVEWQRFRKAYGITAHFTHGGVDHTLYPCQVWKMRVLLRAVKP